MSTHPTTSPPGQVVYWAFDVCDGFIFNFNFNKVKNFFTTMTLWPIQNYFKTTWNTLRLIQGVLILIQQYLNQSNLKTTWKILQDNVNFKNNLA